MCECVRSASVCRQQCQSTVCPYTSQQTLCCLCLQTTPPTMGGVSPCSAISTPTGTRLPPTALFLLSAGKGVLRYSILKWLPLPYLMWGVVVTACVALVFSKTSLTNGLFQGVSPLLVAHLGYQLRLLHSIAFPSQELPWQGPLLHFRIDLCLLATCPNSEERTR